MFELDSILGPEEDEMGSTPAVVSKQRSGWGIFDEEVAWFLYDFFRFKLDGYEKIIFYSYYINGLTLEEIAESSLKSHQAVSQDIMKINNKLAKTWKTKKNWKVDPSECAQPNKRDRRRDKKGS